jgi:hypothetical protein
LASAEELGRNSAQQWAVVVPGMLAAVEAILQDMPVERIELLHRSAVAASLSHSVVQDLLLHALVAAQALPLVVEALMRIVSWFSPFSRKAYRFSLLFYLSSLQYRRKHSQNYHRSSH